MKYRFMFLTIFLIGILQLKAQIQFKNTEVDFGQIKMNDNDVKKEFLFENVGNEKIWFGSTDPTYLSIRTIKIPYTPIMPGEKGSVSITISPSKEKLGFKTIQFKLYHTFSKEPFTLKFSYDIIIDKDSVEKELYKTAMKGSIEDCNNYLKQYPNGIFINDIKSELARREKLLFQNAEKGSIADCDKYMYSYPSGLYINEVTKLKAEKSSYEKAKSGGITDCDAYIAKYPSGAHIEEVKSIKAEKKAVAARNSTIKANSNKALWKLGNKVCCETSGGGIICGTINQWNEDKSQAQIKIVTSPGGYLEGEKLTKNNLIWIQTSGKGWHLCLEDEIQKSIKNDNSEEKQIINSAPSNTSKCSKCGGSGRCSKCAGKGQYLCDYHDTNKDGYCTTCKNLGYLKCYSCNGSGKCSKCGGSGK